MSKAEKTKDFIIERSATIFNTKGYAGTSLSDIIEATGLTKGAIYGNFENKDEVAVAVYKFNIRTLRRKLAAVMTIEPTAPGKLIAMVDYYRHNWKSVFENGGCPILNASIEADDNVIFLKKHVQESIANWVIQIAGIIEAGKKEGTINKSVNAQDYAYAILTQLEGGMMLAKIMNNRKLLIAALDRIVLLINNELKK